MLSAAKLDPAENCGVAEFSDRSSDESSSSPKHQTLGCLILAFLNDDADTAHKQSGQNLMRYLSKLSAEERTQLIGNPQVQHYLHRLVQHAVQRGEHDEMMEKLADYFPTKFDDFLQQKLPFSYSYSDIKRHARAKSTPAKIVIEEHHELFNYDPSTLAATFKGPQVKLKDLGRASVSVETEVKNLEKTMCGLSPAKPRTLSLGLQRPSAVSFQLSADARKLSRASKKESKTPVEKPFLVPVLTVDVNDPHFKMSKSRKSLFPQKHLESFVPLQSSPVTVNGLPLRNAFDVIEAFASGELQAESESVYLNFAHSDHCTPYDLSVTLKTKVKPEHFVISNFGIIHVYPDGMSDFQTFAEWLREASMFTLLRQIPFFREYKLKRTFWQWHKAVLTIKIHRTTFKINRIAIRFFPIYADALLKLSKLSEELMTIAFHHLKPLGGYTVDAMEHSLQGSQTKARQFLYKYFKYSRRIVCAAINASRKHASDLEAEHHHQQFVPEVPLSIQKKRYDKLERDLEAATYQRERIGDFIYLAEQLVYNCLLQLARSAATSWKETFLSLMPKQPSSGFQIVTPSRRQSIDPNLMEGNYFLSSSLAVDSTGKVITEPKSSQIEDLFCTFFHDTVEILTSAVCQLDLPFPEKSVPVTAPRPSTKDSQSTGTPEQLPTFDPSSTSYTCVHSEKRHFHDIPPSLAPARQSKTVVKALRAISHPKCSFDFSVSNQLASQTARNLLGTKELANIDKVDSVLKRRSSVLSRGHFAEALKNDQPYQLAMKEITVGTRKVATQMDSLCEQYDWLSDVWEFISSWKGSQREYNMSADDFEMTLNQLYKWRNQFVAFPSELLTPYALVCISTSVLVETFQSTLASIQNKIKTVAIQRSWALCERVLEETKRRGEVLSIKRYDLEGFAKYANHLRESHEFQSKEQLNIVFVLKLHSILQRQGIEVPQQHKELGKELNEVWHSFEQTVAEAEAFVAKQTPLKAQGLQESIKSAEEELHALVAKISQGEFIDPGQSPGQLVSLLDEVQEKVSTVHSHLLGLCKWKQEITGLPHDLSNVNSLLEKVYVRQEIWKYRGTFDGFEKKWMETPFKKLDVNMISTKVADWLEVCKKLEGIVGAEDPVLFEWKERLMELQKEMPLLLQLSSENLKNSHWVTIFATLGEEYDSNQQYTLTDFSLYNIYDHTNLIFEICHDAMQSDKLKTNINDMQLKLESQKIIIIQVPLECYPFALASDSTQGRKAVLDVINSNTTDKVAGTGKKGTSFAVDFANPMDSTTQYAVRSLYTIGNSEQLLMELENDEIQLKIHQASPHMGGQSHKVSSLLDVVARLRELVQLITECQEQWQYLLSLMKFMDSPLLKALGLMEMHRASSKFQEITESIRVDPRLLSLLEKRRGQKGFREMQGEALRQSCNTILTILNSIKQKVKTTLDTTIGEFPRLCYVTDRDLLMVACNRGNPVPIIPIITRVFPAIHSIRFTELIPSKHTLTHSSQEEEGFQILFVKDRQDKQLSLCVPLPLEKKPAAEWLNGLEYSISYSLASALNDVYSSLPALLKGMEVLTEHQAPALLDWLNKHLNQCVLLSMELHWALVLHSALTSEDPLEQLKQTSIKLSCALESVSEVMLKWNDDRPPSTNLLLQHLILLLRHKSDMTHSLMKEETCSLESFKWKSQIQYSAETENLYNLSPPKGIPAQDSEMTSSTHSTSRHFKNYSPMPAGGKIQDTLSLVASSKSLLNSRHPAVLGNQSVASLRSVGSIGGGHRVRGSTPPLKCFVHCHQTTLAYGYEFLGSSAHLLLTPQTESCLLSLVNAIASRSHPSIHTGSHCTGKDLAVVLGRHLYTVECCLLTNAAALRHLLFGALCTGSLLQLDNFHCLSQLLMLQLGKWLEVVSATLSKLHPESHHTTIDTAARTEQESSRLTSAPLHKAATPSNFEPIPEVNLSSSDDMERSPSVNWPPELPTSHSPTKMTQSNSLLSHHSSRHSHLLDHGLMRSTTTSRATTRLDWYQLMQEVKPGPTSLSSWNGYGGQIRSAVEMDDGTMLKISPAFGCILVGDSNAQSIPEQLKCNFRSVHVMQPDLTYLSEALLVSHCFSEAQELGYAISRFMKQLKQQLSSSNPSISSSIGPLALRHIIDYAAHLVLDKDNTFSNPRLGFNIESRCLVTSVLYHFAPQLVTRSKNNGDDDEDEEEDDMYGDSTNATSSSISWNKLRELLSSYFPSCNDVDFGCLEKPQDQELLDAIDMQLHERHLQTLPSLVEKVKQLHFSLQSSRCVILSGPSGSGKTTCFRTLAAAYQYIRELQALENPSRKTSDHERKSTRHHKFEYPTVSITVINPGAYTMDELFGCYTEVSVPGESSHSAWQDGILTAHIRQILLSDEIRAKNLHPDLNSTLQPLASVGAPATNWLILDGSIGPVLNELIHHLVTNEGMTLKSGEKLRLPESCQLIIECTTLDHMTPSFLSASSLIHCSRDTLSFNAIINTWLDKAPTMHNLSPISAETLAIMIRQVLPETLTYLEKTNQKHYGAEYMTWSRSQVYGLAETQNFLRFLSAVLERNAPKKDADLSHTGLSSRYSSSRISSSMSESRASSVMAAYSTTSVQTDNSSDPSDQTSIASKQNIPPANNDDNVSEVSNLEAEMALSLQVQMAAMLAFAYIWSLGAFVPFSESSSFSELARDLIMQLPYAVPLPEEGSVFDYFLDLKIYQFLPWSERKAETRSRSLGTGGRYIVLPELERFGYITDLYISYGFDVILTGEVGTGKSSFVSNILRSRLAISKLPVNGLLTPVELQTNIIQKLTQLEKKSGQRLLGGSKKSHRNIFFLDDLHSAMTISKTNIDRDVPSPVLELMRYMLCHGKLTNFMRTCEQLLNSRFITVSTPGDYWRLPIRMTHTMCRVPFLPLSDESLHQIFSGNLNPWLEEFPLKDSSQVADALSAALVTVYRSVSEKFRPSTSHPHYLITMHDLLRVFEGLLLLSSDTKAQKQPQFLLNRRGFQSSTQSGKPVQKRASSTKLKSGHKSLPSLTSKKSLVKKKLSKKPKKHVDSTEAESTLRMLIRLWCHETTRVYLDRNTDSKERIWLLKLLETCIKYCFCGVPFDESQSGSKDKSPFRPAGGHTASQGRRVRGSRARGGAMPSVTHSVEGLNPEELAGSGIKVGTLKVLFGRSKEGDSADLGSAAKTAAEPPNLISMDKVTMRGEDLTGLIFAHFPNCPPSSQSPGHKLPSRAAIKSSPSSSLSHLPSSSGYNELGDGQVMEVLSMHLKRFEECPNSADKDGDDDDDENEVERSGKNEKSTITLFKEALEHCARLYRAMNLPGANVLLLGTKGSGRKSLLRLMSYIRKSKVIELDFGDDKPNLKKCLREACISAAVDSQHTVLVVSNQSKLTFQEWQSVVTVMDEGVYPGLFTSSELLVMSGKLEAGKMKRTAEMALMAFSKAVSAHLSVFVLWNTDSVTGSLFSARSSLGDNELSYEMSLRTLFQSICQKCSYIDYYQPWSKHAYSEIALKWWQKESSAISWQAWADTSSQLEAIASLAAHIHITTTELLIRAYGEAGRHLVTPRLFIECLKITQKVAVQIKKQEQVDVPRLEAALEQVKSIDYVVLELEEHLSMLTPNLAAAEQEVQSKMDLITAAKEKYMEAHKRCKVAEETIDCETSNVKLFSKTVEDKTAEVTPIYEASLEALASVKFNDILEMMKYREPPQVLIPLFNAMCMLFDREESWDECKQLLMTKRFLDSLRFYDRDHIPELKVRRLKQILAKNMNFKGLVHGSQAVRSLCMWINALLAYHKIMKVVEPLKAKLKRADQTLANAKKTFIAMQKDMIEAKEALENRIKEHRESIKQARAIESEINELKLKLEKAQEILKVMSSERKKWMQKLDEISSRIDSVPGHAMLCAAGTCYLPSTPPDRHKDLVNNWLGYCSGAVPLGSLAFEQSRLQSTQGYGAYSGQQQVVRIQKDFAMAKYLSEKEECCSWQQQGTFPDEAIMDRYLASRTVCKLGTSGWPLIFDPYQQLRAIFPNEEESTMIIFLNCMDRQLVSKLRTAVLIGKVVVISLDEGDVCDYTIEQKDFMSKLLRKEFKLIDSQEGSDYILDLSTDQSPVPVHPQQQIYFTICSTIKSAIKPDGSVALSPFLTSLGLQNALHFVDIELKKKALEKSMLDFVLSKERPEYQISHRSLLADLSLHEQELEIQQGKMLEYTLDPKNSNLLLAEELMSTISKTENAELAVTEQVREAKKNLHMSDQLVLPYKPFSHWASVVLTNIQKVSSVLCYFTFSVDEFQTILSKVISEFKGLKVADHTMSIKAHVIHLKNELLLRVHRRLQMRVFEHHQILIPLLIGLEMQLEQGKVTENEVECLGRNLGELDAQLDLARDTNNRGELLSKPKWITDKSWCNALEIQKEIPALRRLSIEISDFSNEWKEYFDMDPAILAPLPGFGDSCSLVQKLLLWKAFKPEKFCEVVSEFVLVAVGSEFVRHRTPSWNEILVHTTSPHMLTLLLLQPSNSSHTPLTAAEVIAAANRCGLESRYCSLHKRESCKELMESLQGAVSSSCCVIVEHCHLLPNCHEVLTQLTEILETHRERAWQTFRLLVLMPVEHISKCPTIGCKMIAYQNKTFHSSKMSAHLLQDLDRLLWTSSKSAKHPPGLWDSYKSTVSKLKAFLPSILSPPQLADLDPQQNSLHALPSLIYEELCLHNESLIPLHASLEQMSSCLENKVPLSNTMGETLLSLASDAIPKSWTDHLPKPLSDLTSLMSMLKLLNARVAFYRRTLHSGTLPSKLNPLLFSNPQDLVFSKACCVAAECRLSTSAMLMEGKLQVGQVEKQVHSLVLFGLTLCSGTWDEAASCLKPLTVPEGEPVRNTYCIIITYKPKEEEPSSLAGTLHGMDGAMPEASSEAKQVQPQPHTYNCPVLMSSKKLEDKTSRRALVGGSQSPLFHVPLRATGDSSEIFLLCNSELHDVYM